MRLALREGVRVLQVVLNLSPGGTERLTVEIVKRLSPHIDMSVCCLDEPGAWADELTRCGIHVEALHRSPGFHPSLGRCLAATAARRRASILHCHHYSPFVYGRIATLLNPRLRMVFTEHGRLSDAPPQRKRMLINRALSRMPGLMFAVSEDLRSHMVREGFAANRLQVIHNGIDPGRPPSDADRRHARGLLGVAPDQITIGTVGRLDPVKDLGTLIEAFATLRKSAAHSDTTLVVVGDGSERAQLEAKVSGLGLHGSVVFTGYRRDVQRLLPAFDLYVNSSIHEGVSLTILEAMAAVVPVVATRAGGNVEVVVDGETGRLTPPRNAQALADAMLDIISSPATRQAMGAAGRARVEQHFTLDRMVREYHEAYASVAPRHGLH